MFLVRKEKSANHFQSQDTGLEVVVHGDGNFFLPHPLVMSLEMLKFYILRLNICYP